MVAESAGGFQPVVPLRSGRAGDAGSQIRWLASTALDENQLVRLSRAIQKLRDSNHPLAPLTPYRLAILSNSTTDFFPPVLTATAARHGLALD